MEKLQVSRLTPEAAAHALIGLEKHDPRGISTQQDLQRWASEGQCFAVGTSQAQAVYIVNEQAGQIWVQAAKAEGTKAPNFVHVLTEVIKAQAQGRCHSIGFQTARPGLVRKARREGFEVVGWIMKKGIE